MPPTREERRQLKKLRKKVKKKLRDGHGGSVSVEDILQVCGHDAAPAMALKVPGSTVRDLQGSLGVRALVRLTPDTGAVKLDESRAPVLAKMAEACRAYLDANAPVIAALGGCMTADDAAAFDAAVEALQGAEAPFGEESVRLVSSRNSKVVDD